MNDLGQTRLAGIDPSLTATGIVVMNRIGFGRHAITWLDVVRTDPSEGPGRLSKLRGAVVASLAGEPGVCGVECNYAHDGRSIQTALQCREAVAVCIEAAASLGWRVVRVAPTEAKKALGLRGGRSDKPQMVDPAARLFPHTFRSLKFKYQREAIADAIGVAMVAGQPQNAIGLEAAK